MADQHRAAGAPGGSESGTATKAKEKATEMKNRTQDKMASAADEARHRGEQLTEQAKSTASEVKHKAQQKAREGGDRAVREARSRADEQRQRVAGGVRTVAEALRRGGSELPEDRRQYGKLLDGVAERVEDVSHYLEDRDVDALARDARRFAREHTPLFLGGAFTLGMMGARFLKSSSEGARERSYPFDEEYGGTGEHLYGRPRTESEPLQGRTGSTGTERTIGEEGYA